MSDSTDSSDSPQKKARNTSRSRAFCFTFNNYTDSDLTQLIETFNESTEKYIFQEEMGKEGTPHLQGVVKFKNQRSFDALKKINTKIHWEICKNWIASVKYCSKQDSKNGKLWSKGIDKPATAEIIDDLADRHLYDWQKCVLEEIIPFEQSTRDIRTINWIVDPIGACGKTCLAKHMCMTNELCIYITGKSADVKFAISGMKVKPEICLFDFTRSNEQYVSYQAIEEVKNGIFFSTKYESRQVIFNPPTVIIFSNWMPDIDKLSIDRWKVYMVTEDKSLQCLLLRS